MSDFTIVERTEPITLDEVLSFIDDTNISKMDAHELKSRIADVIQESRNKIVDEFAEKLCVACGSCLTACKLGAVSIPHGVCAMIDEDKCVGCGRCIGICNFDAVKSASDANGDILNKKMQKGEM